MIESLEVGQVIEHRLTGKEAKIVGFHIAKWNKIEMVELEGVKGFETYMKTEQSDVDRDPNRIIGSYSFTKSLVQKNFNLKN